MTRRTEAGFVACRSAIKASKIHREFDRPLNVDINAAFDSVNCSALWKALNGQGVPDIILELIKNDNTGVQICIGKKLSSGFKN